jgi:hypothetical protein
MKLIAIILSGSLLLQGSVTNEYGRVGVLIGLNGNISHVYKYSPAKTFGLQVGDIILEADGHKGYTYTDGCSQTLANLVIKRGTETFKIIVPRVPSYCIYDKPPEDKKPR